MKRRLFLSYFHAILLSLVPAAPTRSAAAPCIAERDAMARLACYERAAASCLKVPVEADRLACFDRLADFSPPPQQQPVAETTPGASAIGPSPAVAATEPELQPRFRIQAGMDYTQGRFQGTIPALKAKFKTDSLLGGSGTNEAISLWDDRLVAPTIGLGLEYLHLSDTADVNGLFPHGISVFTDPQTVRARLRIAGDLVFGNLAYRPRPDDTLRPYFGAGLGVGRGRLTADFKLEGFLEDAVLRKFTSWIAAAQVFAGVEVDLGDGFYLNPAMRTLYFTLQPVGRNYEYIDIGLGMNVGYQF
jgi:hypothetical protein